MRASSSKLNYCVQDQISALRTGWWRSLACNLLLQGVNKAPSILFSDHPAIRRMTGWESQRRNLEMLDLAALSSSISSSNLFQITSLEEDLKTPTVKPCCIEIKPAGPRRPAPKEFERALIFQLNNSREFDALNQACINPSPPYLFSSATSIKLLTTSSHEISP